MSLDQPVMTMVITLILPDQWAILFHRIVPEVIEEGHWKNVADIDIFDHSWNSSVKAVIIYLGIIFAHTIADLLFLATKYFDPEDPPRCVHNLPGAISDPLYDLIDQRKI